MGQPNRPWSVSWLGGGRYSLWPRRRKFTLKPEIDSQPAMANIVVKTIWQSKEINEAGDTPTGVEGRAHSSKEQLGKSSSIKTFPKKKKAVSFHGVEPHLTSESPNLHLKRSSACTNVSLLNLTDGEHEDSTTESKPSDDGGSPEGAAGERKDPPLPVKAIWSEDDYDNPIQQQEVSNSGLLRVKDSITSLKERTSKVNRHVQNLQNEYKALCENLEQRRQEAEDLEEYCTQLKGECSVLCENLDQRRQEAKDLEEYCTQLRERCRKVTKSVEDAEVKTNLLKKNSVLLEEKLCFLQRQVQAEDLSQQVKPFLEDVSQHLSAFKTPDTLEKYPASCSRCASYSFVNTEMLRQMVENAVAPILEELKQRTPPLGTCPSCQRLQKKIMDLKQSALDTHTGAEVLSSNIHLAQDEAWSAKNHLERARINPEDKASGLDYLLSKLSFLRSQLSLVSQEGALQPEVTSMAGALMKKNSCPAELNRNPSNE
ncbi:testis-specific serine kinase substrate [Heteronotia binoei]|uniref:testis-specific serine kinase substrate n=1 Tax=Heteronotia binoei TaxID=13085 RepID=UPI00292FC391|nr:testis-specific serine kinase substrate [Heteronotia binoei]